MPIRVNSMTTEDYLNSSWNYDAFGAPSPQNQKNFHKIKNSKSLGSFQNLENFSQSTEIYSLNKEIYHQTGDVNPESYDFVDLDEQQDMISNFQDLSPTQTHSYLLEESMGMGMKTSSMNNLNGQMKNISNGSSIFPAKGKSSLGLRSHSISNFQSKETSSLFSKTYKEANSVNWEDANNQSLRYRSNGDRGFSSLYPASTGNLGGLIGNRSDSNSKNNLDIIHSLFQPSTSLTYNRSDTDLVASFDRSLKISEECEVNENIEMSRLSSPKKSPGPIRKSLPSFDESAADHHIESQASKSNLITPSSSSPTSKTNQFGHQKFSYGKGPKSDFYGSDGKNIDRNSLMNNIYHPHYSNLHQFDQGYGRGREDFFHENEELNRYETFMLEQFQNQQQQLALFQNQQQQLALYQSLLMRGAAQMPFPGMLMPGYMNGMNMLAMPNLAAQAGLNRAGNYPYVSAMDMRDYSRNGTGYVRDSYDERDNRRGMFDIMEDLGDGNIYQVQFKRGIRYFLLSSSCERNLKTGDYVKVEADRGEDLGLIVCINSINSSSSSSSSSSKVSNVGYRSRADINNCQKERILRAANDMELAQFRENMIEEKNVLAVCRAKVLQRCLPMEVMDAEYQYDRHKLTFFFKAEGRIDFRELVRDLYALYKTRIWMQQVDPSHVTMPIPGERMSNENILLGKKITYDCESSSGIGNSSSTVAESSEISDKIDSSV